MESSISDSVSGYVPPSADTKANPFGFTPGMSQEEYQEALKNANPDDVKNAMNAMDNMLDSNVFEEYLSDDDKLEKARQQMLANMDHYATMMPGFKVKTACISILLSPIIYECISMQYTFECDCVMPLLLGASGGYCFGPGEVEASDAQRKGADFEA